VIAVVLQIEIHVQPGHAVDSLLLQGKAHFLQKAQALIDNPHEAGDPGRIQAVHSRLNPLYADYKAVQGKQRWLMVALSVFLVVTLVGILAPAIIGIIQIEWVKTWAWTSSLLYVASALLAILPTWVVLMAAFS
jgi:hypothetical protein